jgi:hypothetical protein
MKRVIGLSGVAGSGKDTMFALLNFKNSKIKRFALADCLKNELNIFTKDLYKIDLFNCTREEKDLIRPLLVAHGKIRRTLTNGTYWTSKLTEEIKNFLNQDEENIAVITDIRYAEYEEDELFWLKKQLGGYLIHITMNLDNNEKLKAPNREEEQNDPILKKNADYRVIWNKVEPFSFKNLNLLTHAEKIEKFIRS